MLVHVCEFDGSFDPDTARCCSDVRLLIKKVLHASACPASSIVLSIPTLLDVAVMSRLLIKKMLHASACPRVR